MVSVPQRLFIQVKVFFEQCRDCHGGVIGYFLRDPHNPEIISERSSLQVLAFIFQLRHISWEILF